MCVKLQTFMAEDRIILHLELVYKSQTNGTWRLLGWTRVSRGNTPTIKELLTEEFMIDKI